MCSNLLFYSSAVRRKNDETAEDSRLMWPRSYFFIHTTTGGESIPRVPLLSHTGHQCSCDTSL